MKNVLIFIATILMSAQLAHADENEKGPDWFGLKSYLQSKGITAEASYVGDSVTNMSGGIDEKSGYLGLGHIEFSFDLDQMMGFAGSSFVISANGAHGDDPTTFVGDAFATSNIEADNAFKISEIYFQKAFGEKSALIIGTRDLNVDFYATEASGAFLNSAFGISPSITQTGVNGPSVYPTTALAATFSTNFENNWYLHVGAFNAVAGDPAHVYDTRIETDFKEGELLILESGIVREESVGLKQLSLGIWDYTKKQSEIIDTTQTSNNLGVYILSEYGITEKLHTFFKFGTAADKINEFGQALELGLVLSSPFASRENDSCGLGFGSATRSDDYKDTNGVEAQEAVIEGFYRYEVVPGFALVPDYQHVQNPGGDATLKNADVFTLRFEISL